MSAWVLIGVAMLGGLGSVARVAVVGMVRSGFPAGILVVNVTGSLALGLVVGAGAHGEVLRLVGVGLLGGYTTYSAWMVDTDALPRGQAAANVVVSLAAGLAAVWLGRAIA